MRCPGCPVSTSLACHALASGHWHWCLQREGDPALAAYIVEHSGTGDEPAERPETKPPAPIDPLSILVDTCPFLASCSCHDLRTCLLSTFPVTVTRATCRACAAGQSEAAP